MSDSALNRFGFTGKHPQHRDFVHAGLPFSFTQHFHEWLQAAIAVSREQLDNRWLTCYLSSPIWNFAFSEGVVGEHVVVGTMMPSVDGAGRHYPLSLVAEVEGRAPSYWANSHWAEATSKKLLDALSEDSVFDEWQDLSKLNSAIEKEFCSIIKHQKSGTKKNQQGYFLHDACRHDTVTALADYLACNHSVYCLWWTEGSELVAPCMMVTEGLPRFSQFSSMLDGNWTARGWL